MFYSDILLAGLELVRWESTERTGGVAKLFVVRFLKWSGKWRYPLGYISDVIQADNMEQYFKIAYDVPKAHS